MVLDKRDPGAAAYLITILVNLGLAAAKLGAGTVTGSPALLADGWHSLSDVAMNALAWAGYQVAKAPPDDDHHYGHGNWEAVASLIVGLVVMGAGVAILVGVAVANGGGTAPGRGALALAVAIAAGLAKLVLALYTSRVGIRLNSPSLIAVSRDNMADSLTGALVPVAIGASLLGFAWAEPVCALLIAGVILWMGIKSARQGLDILMDRVDPSLRETLEQTAQDVEGVSSVQRARIHPLGSELRVDMEISVDGNLTVAEGHRIAHEVESVVVDVHKHVVEVSVHVNPAQDPAHS